MARLSAYAFQDAKEQLWHTIDAILANLSEIQMYAEILKTELDNFLDNEIRDQHKVSAYYSDQLAVIKIEYPEIPPQARYLFQK